MVIIVVPALEISSMHKGFKFSREISHKMIDQIITPPGQSHVRLKRWLLLQQCCACLKSPRHCTQACHPAGLSLSWPHYV